jgi:hypothetical protein
VLNMTSLELLHCSLDGLHATLFAHLSRRDVGVQTSAVPV